MTLPPLRLCWSALRPSATLAVALVLSLLAGPAITPQHARAASAPGDWSTSFEGEVSLDGTLATGPGGRPDVSGVLRPGSAEPGLRTIVDDGPDRAYAAKADVGFTGLHALHYTGRHEPQGPAHATHVLIDVDVPVGPQTELSYLVLPDFDEAAVDYAGTYVAVDLAFTDGSRLSELAVDDQHGVPLTARAQGDAKTLAPLQWNRRSAVIGKAAAGKTVDKILLTYDGPAGPADLGGWIDDLAIDSSPDQPVRSRPSDWVITTRGTHSNGDYSRGNSFPATAVPNGFNFWTPVTDAGSLGTLYRYHDGNNAANLPEIQAFSASHQTSIWMGDRQTFQVMPSAAAGVPDPDRKARALPFRHQDERASPHHYAVTFQNGLRTDIAPADHAAMFRFTFPAGGGRHLIFDNVDDRAGLTIDATAGTVSGWSETRVISAGMTRMYMYATFDAPITGSGLLTQGQRPSTGYVSFGRDVVTMRIATSLIGVDQARKNLDLEIAAADRFEDVAARARSAWDDRLGVVEVRGARDDQLITLYSNLYRLFLYPNSAHENTGTRERPRYRHAVQSSGSWSPPPSSPTRTGARIADGKAYVNTGFWDTFRAAWPAYYLLAPETAGELVDGFVQQYRDGGWISPWSSPGYARVMTGTNSDAAFADAYVKGVPGIDPADTYAAALKNATVRPEDGSVGRDGLARSTFLGYVPNDLASGFSWSLDGYVNDFGIAAMAEAMAGRRGTPGPERRRLREEAAYFRDRSQGYADVFDASAGFFQGRSADGKWTTPPQEYDPRVWGNDHDYTEANGWNEAFPAPHDGQGLAELYGGRDGLAAKLDTFFATPETAKLPGSYGRVIHEMRETRDLRLGQWSIPNQVSHHIPWMYAYTQQPWKTQEQVRQAVERGWLGSEIGQGYPGDEDNGATSAWWVFSALGLYPLQIGTGQYAIGSPLFEKATLHLPGGDLVIEAPGTSRGNGYVQALTVDGRRHTSTSISHQELADGGRLRFTMGPEPSRWGTGARDVPDSMTRVGERPRPLHDVTGKNRGLAMGGDVGKLFDDDSRTAAVLDGPDRTVRYSVNGGDATRVEFYTFTSGTTPAEQDPGHWVLEGSPDGKRWKKLDERDGERFRWRNQTRPFQIRHPAKMRQYRFRFTGAAGQAALSLAEIELLTRDAIPSSPLQVRVADVALRPGTAGPVEVTLTNTGDTTLAPDLTVAVPASWSARPGNTQVPGLAPGASATVTVEVTAAADAAPGAQPIRVTARWNGWAVAGEGTARVVGDVTEIEPGTASEEGVLVDDNGSQLTGDGAGGQARYADERRSFTYRLPVPAGATTGTVTLDLANQFLVEASADGRTWTTILREPNPVIFQGNRDQRAFDLARLREQSGGDGSDLYLKISDSLPQDGWGGWLAGVRLETTG
ncbi:Alpha-1,2-mannosidase [[Actinomadura] parvosata subsp. kistnae]|uniref:GH92 family glycosyl hydrolase n=1 Tax=[Actinomadura] parvosata TaxID=1955412 RepID=UPI0009AEE58C|nr:GH92 family glycosyl hydrolase [Nonomuraea sp. ATCC 55076]SPL88633.1 Alpha-1,2-mannosidase [Actinomadura parvosata subsp. kistnae]